jgi:hypothetical protein
MGMATKLVVPLGALGSARLSPMDAPSFQAPSVQGCQWAVSAVRVRYSWIVR